MNWDTKRKLLYALSLAVVLIAVTIFSLRDTLFPAPTCSDGKQNGYEGGVDCGGGCALVCKQDVRPLTVVWAKAVKTSQNMYDLVALVSNANINNASYQVGYTFTLFDKNGLITGTLSGSTTAPLDGSFPLIIQSLPLAQPPATVVATLKDGPHYTVTESPSSPTVKIANRRFERESMMRVYATVVNTKQQEIFNLPVRAILFDARDNAYAVGQTIIPVLGKESSKEVTFTWDEPLSLIPTRIGIYPIFNPFEAIGY